MFLVNLPSLAGLNSQPGSTLQLSITVLVWRNKFSANTLISPHLVTGSLHRLIAFWQNAVGHCPTGNSCSEKRLLWRCTCVSIHLINCSRKLSTEFIFSIICRSDNQINKISTRRIWPGVVLTFGQVWITSDNKTKRVAGERCWTDLLSLQPPQFIVWLKTSIVKTPRQNKEQQVEITLPLLNLARRVPWSGELGWGQSVCLVARGIDLIVISLSAGAWA